MKYLFTLALLLHFSCLRAQAPVIQWQKTIGGSDKEQLFSMQPTPDGAFILCGTSKSGVSGNKTTANHGMEDYWIVKMDASGNILWEKDYGGDKQDYPASVVPVSGGGYLVVGGSESGKNGSRTCANYGTAGNASNGRDFWVLKLDASGAIEWQQCYGTAKNDGGFGAVEKPAGGYLLYGMFTSANNWGNNGWIISTNATGAPLWDSTYGGTDNDNMAQLIALPDGGYAAIAHTLSVANSGNHTSTNYGGSDTWLFKTDSLLRISWQMDIGGSGADAPPGTTRSPCDENGLLNTEGEIVVANISNSGADGNKTMASRGGNDYWLVAVDTATGAISWQVGIGGSGADILSCVIQTSDSGYLLGGYSASGISGDKDANSKGSNDYWIVKLDRNRNIQWQQTIGGSGDDQLMSVIETGKGEYLLGGYSKSGVSGDKSDANRGDFDWWIIKLVTPRVCAGMPATGVITTTADSICIRETATLVLGNNAYGTQGISYQWQKRVPSGSGSWTDIPSARDTLLNVSGLTATTDYRCLVICGNSSDTSYSNALTVKSIRCNRHWYVNASGGNDNNTGYSWTDAFATVQKALDACWSGDTVWVAKGTYVPVQDRNGDVTSARSRYRTFMLKDSVKIYGGFSGNEPPGYDIGLRDFTANETILSGDLNGNDGSGFANNNENVFNVVGVAGSVSDVTALDGVTITGGNANGSGAPTGYGGGMSIEGGCSVRVSNVVFLENSANLGGGGGGVNMQNCTPTFINIRFIGNRGGGMRLYQTNKATSAVLTNCVFRDNPGQDIGGLRTTGTVSLTLTNVTFYNNSSTATSNGGAAVCLSGPTVAGIRNCILYGNTSTSGGADLNGSGTVTLRNSLVGGDYYDASGNVTPGGYPSFIDSAARNLRLQAGSALRGIGDPGVFSSGQTPDLSAITTDLDGQPRIVGGQIDVGAYQSNYTSCAGVPLPGIITAGADSVCVRETVTLALSQNSHHLSGISYLWQKRVPSGSGAWTNMLLATDTLLPVSGQAATTDYRCLVICGNSSDTSYSNIVTVNSYPCDHRWYVQASGGNDNNTGHSWTDAFATVQQALDASWPGDTVWVAKGIYVPVRDRNGSAASGNSRYRTFMLKDSVKIYGGFSGNEPTGYDIGLRDFTANETILSGDLNGNDGSGFANNNENVFNVVGVAGSVSDVTALDGVTITGGNANGSGAPTGYGGGISIEGGCNPVLSNVIFLENSANLGGGGGGVNMQNCAPTFINIRFIGNRGGGMRLYQTNKATSAVLTNCVFRDNAGQDIGGLRTTGTVSLTLTNVTFYNNSSTATSNGGAGVCLSGSTVAGIRNCILYGNISTGGGGDINNSGTVTFRNSLVGGNYYNGSGSISSMGAPLFINAAAGDLRLQAGCPLRNTGDTTFFNAGQTPDLSAVTTDIAGAPRIVAGLIDPGAYQTSYPPLDATVVAFVEPEDGDTVCASGSLPVKIAVANYGNQTLSGMPVTLDYGIGTINTALAGPLPAGHTDTLLIPGADMSAPGPRRIKAYTLLSGDADAGNDTLQVNVMIHVPSPVLLGNDTAFCAGDTLVLDAGAGAVVNWNTGASTSVISVAGSGIYAVTVTDSVGCAVYDTIQVTVYPLPAAVVTPAGNVAFCQGDSVTLRAGAQPGVAYVWQKDGIPVGSDTDYTAAAGGQYRVLVSDSHHCSDSSAATVVEVLPQPVVEVTPPEAGFCTGGNVLLEGHCPDTTGLAWQWMDAKGLIPGADASFYQVDVPGTYRLAAKRTGAAVVCADSSEPVVVTEYPLPAPVIYWDGVTLSTDSLFATYQWYCDGQLLPFATSYRYVPAQPGGFNVMVTDTNGCDNASAPIHVQPTRTGQLPGYSGAVRVYPNPVSAMLMIESSVAMMITVSGMDGATVLRESAEHPGKIILNLAGLADGMYYLRITGQDGLLLHMEKLVKNSH